VPDSIPIKLHSALQWIDRW